MEVFEGLVGQEGAKRILSAGLASGSLPQALVFAGPDGVGRRTAATMLAMALHADDNSAYLADTFWFGLNYADKSARKVSGAIKETADDLVHFMQLSPLISKRKVAIIENAEDLSDEAQNALLKTLEEPRADSVIILIVESEHRLLPTILSRVQVVKFVLLTDSQVREVVGERVTDEIVAFAHGSAGMAMQLFENFELLEETRKITEFWKKVGDMDTEAKLAWSEKMKEREAATRFLQTGLRVMWRQMVQDANNAQLEQVEEVDKTLARVSENANVRMALDALFLGL